MQHQPVVSISAYVTRMSQASAVQVTLLAVTKQVRECEAGRLASSPDVFVDFVCLQQHHFLPEVWPFRQLRVILGSRRKGCCLQYKDDDLHLHLCAVQ